MLLILMLTSFKSKEEQWFCEDLKYTYQIEIHNSRKQVAVSSDICEMITSKRNSTEIVTVQLDANVFLKIFPVDQLETMKENQISQFVYIQ